MNIDDIAKLVAVLEGTDVAELEFEQDGVTLRIVRAKQVVAAAPQVFLQTTAAPSAPAAVAPAELSKIHDDTAGLIKVESPIVGTFYRKPAPDAANFVEPGTKVSKGQRLCIIEAMKLMNEIEAPASGIIERVLVEDSSVVEFGELLFLIRPA